MLIGEASRKTGLRLRLFGFIPTRDFHPRKDPFTGYRFFTETDLTRLRFEKSQAV